MHPRTRHTRSQRITSAPDNESVPTMEGISGLSAEGDGVATSGQQSPTYQRTRQLRSREVTTTFVPRANAIPQTVTSAPAREIVSTTREVSTMSAEGDRVATSDQQPLTNMNLPGDAQVEPMAETGVIDTLHSSEAARILLANHQTVPSSGDIDPIGDVYSGIAAHDGRGDLMIAHTDDSAALVNAGIIDTTGSASALPAANKEIEDLVNAGTGDTTGSASALPAADEEIGDLVNAGTGDTTGSASALPAANEEMEDLVNAGTGDITGSASALPAADEGMAGLENASVDNTTVNSLNGTTAIDSVSRYPNTLGTAVSVSTHDNSTDPIVINIDDPIEQASSRSEDRRNECIVNRAIDTSINIQSDEGANDSVQDPPVLIHDPLEIEDSNMEDGLASTSAGEVGCLATASDPIVIDDDSDEENDPENEDYDTDVPDYVRAILGDDVIGAETGEDTDNYSGKSAKHGSTPPRELSRSTRYLGRLKQQRNHHTGITIKILQRLIEQVEARFDGETDVAKMSSYGDIIRTEMRATGATLGVLRYAQGLIQDYRRNMSYKRRILKKAEEEGQQC